MIKSLFISNFAIIADLKVTFGKGLNIITGETGAGKSIMLDALGLVLGKRADSSVLINKDDKCVVEAEFDVSNLEMSSFFERHEVDYDDLTIVRREISPTGRTRAFVNDTPVKLSFLSDLSDFLIEVHQQFDHLSIREEVFQRAVLDTLAGQLEEVGEYKGKFQSWASGQRKLNMLKEKAANNLQEMDFVRFQLEELDAADLIVDEEQALNNELNLLSKSDDIKTVLHTTSQSLADSEDNLVDKLKSLSQMFRSFTDHAELSQMHERFDALITEIEDLSRDAQGLMDSIESNPGRMMEIEERMSILFRLVPKHSAVGINDLITVRDKLRDRLNGLTSAGEDLFSLEKELDEQRKWLEEQGEHISKGRSAVIGPLQSDLEATLQHLGMPDAVFRVQVEPKELDESGKDQITFTFSSNKGIPPAPIKLTASGGEISRLNLAVKSKIAGKLALPTMILDEIDAGVSGETARRIGRLLMSLGQNHQIACITHTPQIASLGSTHLHVMKSVVDGKTSTKVRSLNNEERVDIIGQMLGGDPPGAAALEAAKALLSDSEHTV
jgi:DNA repair protein RecN (Recombination protein N)